MNAAGINGGRLVLVWEGIDLPPNIATELRSSDEILASDGCLTPLVMIGTERPSCARSPRLWIGERFGEPTGPAGDPWPVPAGMCEPTGAVASLSGARVRPEQCDEFWLSYFLPDWREVDQDRDSVLVRLALAWSEAMTLSSIVDQAAQDAVPGAEWIVRWRFGCWWPMTGIGDRPSRIGARALDFLTVLSHRAIAATHCKEVLIINAWPRPGTKIHVWKWR